MFETEVDDDLAIPAFDEAAIERFGEFLKDQMRHQYTMGRLQGRKDAEAERKATEEKYGR